MRDVKTSIKLEITRIFNGEGSAVDKQKRAEAYLEREIEDGYIRREDTKDIRIYISTLAYTQRGFL